MNIFPWLKRKEFFTDDEKSRIVAAVRVAEQKTSGEVRIFVESRCPFMDAIDRAAEVFYKLKMHDTDDRNAVLVYVATKDRQLAVFGDEGIHQRVGNEYWSREVARMIKSFNRQDFALGLEQCVLEIGDALHHHFPYNKETDKNELPDEIVFGK